MNFKHVNLFILHSLNPIFFMITHCFKSLFVCSVIVFSISITSCTPTKEASFAEEDTLSKAVVVTPNENEVIPPVDDPIIDTLNGFYEGEYVAVSHGEESWYLAQIVAFDGGKTNLRYMDGDVNTKDFVELMKLDTVDIQKNDRVWALFGDGIRFRQGMVDGIEEDSIAVKFEGYNDGKVHFLRVFKTKDDK